MPFSQFLVRLGRYGLFAVLLIARQIYGWRGRRAALLTLQGFACALVVLLIYLVRRMVG